MACLDTTFILDLRGRGGANLQSRARTTLHQLIQTGQAITTTRINVAELYVGVERSHDPTRELAIPSSLLSTVEILEVDERSARQFGRASAHLFGIGRPVGDDRRQLWLGPTQSWQTNRKPLNLSHFSSPKTGPRRFSRWHTLGDRPHRARVANASAAACRLRWP